MNKQKFTSLALAFCVAMTGMPVNALAADIDPKWGGTEEALQEESAYSFFPEEDEIYSACHYCSVSADPWNNRSLFAGKEESGNILY